MQQGKEAAMNLANLHAQYIVDETNQRRSMILPFAEFQDLLKDIAEKNRQFHTMNCWRN
jgi:hypothetical protein